MATQTHGVFDAARTLLGGTPAKLIQNFLLPPELDRGGRRRWRL